MKTPKPETLFFHAGYIGGMAVKLKPYIDDLDKGVLTEAAKILMDYGFKIRDKRDKQKRRKERKK